MSKPRLLDLFCGAGGCAMGYSRAGFEVVGVDHNPQKNYPFQFIQADALECLLEPANYANGLYDAVHASPPCQAYTTLRALHPKKEYPDLLAPTRALLIKCGLPWVIENVPGSPVHHSITLCGNMFGLRVYRHRLFETPFMIWQPEHKRHKILAGKKGTKGGRQRKAHYMAGGNVTICGDVGSYAGPAMGIDWMMGKELSQAIPPAYTEYIGKQLMRQIL